MKSFFLGGLRKLISWIFIIFLIIGSVSLLSILDRDKTSIGVIIEKSCAPVIKDNDRLYIVIKNNHKILSFKMKLDSPDCNLFLDEINLKEKVKIFYNEGLLTSSLYYLELSDGRVIKGRYYNESN